MENSNYDSSVKIILTSKEFYGKREADIESIIQRIQTYDRDALSIVLAKWQIVLKEHGAHNPYLQLSLARFFVNRSQYKRLRNRIKRKPRLIFSHDVILGLMKLNLQYNDKGGNDLAQDYQAKGLLNLVVSLNSHYVQEVLPDIVDRREHRDEILEEIRYSMAKQALGINSSELLHELYRGKRIIEHLDATQPIFRLKFKEYMGMEIEEYQEILFLLLLDWGFSTGDKPLDGVVIKKLEDYFSNTELAKEKIRKVMDVHSLKPEQFSSLNAYYTQLGSLEGLDDQWNYITFFNKQMMELEQGFLCLSPSSLIRQLSEGPYNIVRQQFKDDDDSASETNLPNWWGKAYEVYILERLKLTFGDNLTATNVLLQNGNESIDAVVELDDIVLLIEVKYPHWKFSSRVNPTRDDVLNHIKKFVDRRKGLGQIKKFLEHHEESRLRQTFNFEGKFILPIIILGEDFPHDPLNRQLINDYAKEYDFLPVGDTIFPFILLTSNEIEIMEGFAEQYGVGMLINILGMFSGGYINDENKSILKRPTTLLNLFALNNIPVQNSVSLSDSLDNLYESLRAKFKIVD